MENKNGSEGSFEILKSYPSFKVGRMTYFVSLQSIKGFNDKKSNHLVIKKVAIADDGSPMGNSKVLFMPADDAEKVLTNILTLIKNK